MSRMNNIDRGHVLIVVLFLLGLVLLLGKGLLTQSADTAKIAVANNQQSDKAYDLENALNEILLWMKSNSQDFSEYFTEDNFDTYFDETLAPSVGTNDTSPIPVVTKVKRKTSTGNSLLITNDSYFGTSNFPVHADNGFNPVTSFNSQDFGGVVARIIMVGVRQDIGNNYDPIYRIQVKDAGDSERGIDALVEGNMRIVGSQFAHWYGENLILEGSANLGVWKDLGGGGCVLATNNLLDNGISCGGSCLASAYGGDGGCGGCGAITVNGDNQADSEWLNNQPLPGNCGYGGTCIVNYPTNCNNTGCHTVSMPGFSDWSGHCSTNQGDLVLSSNQTLNAATDNPSVNCWRDVTLNGYTLEITESEYPYYFRSLDLGSGKVKAVDSGSSSSKYARVVTDNMVVKDICGGHGYTCSANFESYNSGWGALADVQIQLFYTGTETIRYLGAASHMPTYFVVPNGGLNLVDSGGIYSYGGGFAKNLRIYDQSAIWCTTGGIEGLVFGGSSGSDMVFELKEARELN